MWFDQHRYELRCEWGARGVEVLAPHVDALIIVDVLSFSTCVDIAVARGAVVYPYHWKDDRAEAFTKSVGGVLAAARSRTHVSLSPASLRKVRRGTRIVLPSPNGAELSHLTGDTPTLTGCLRNAAAVARRARSFGTRIGVVPAGERWPDGTLRPSVEDWLGAGAILASLDGSCSPETELARIAFASQQANIAAVLRGCASGRELVERGWPEDVELASELSVSECAPILRDGAYGTWD